MFSIDKQQLVTANTALPGRTEPTVVLSKHFVNQHVILPPFPENVDIIYLGMGCFWGAERLFWQKTGVWSTAVGYSGGFTPNPLYDEVCSGMTGHAEVVLIAYQPEIITCQELLHVFWEKHDPTQGMQQGNDRGTQYRSVIFTTMPEQLDWALKSQESYQHALRQAGYSDVTTEIKAAPSFYYAEEEHQQYLAKNPSGYCGIKGTGVCLV